MKNTNDNFGKIEYLNLSEQWPDSNALSIVTTEENLQVLSQRLNRDLEIVSFIDKYEINYPESLESVAKCYDHNLSKELLLICSFNKSTSKHIIDLLIYMAALRYDLAISICSEFTDRHRGVLHYLNEQSKLGIYGAEVELVKIDNSLPALNFNAAVQPYFPRLQ